MDTQQIIDLVNSPLSNVLSVAIRNPYIILVIDHNGIEVTIMTKIDTKNLTIVERE